MAGTYSTPAIVLRARPLGEKDRVLTLLSPEHGKFAASARGARNPKSKLTAVSQPFIYAKFLIARGRSLDIVTQAQIEDAHPHVALHLLKSAWATYLCELCDVVPEELPDEELFELLRVTLSTLDGASEDATALSLIGAWFEARFLAHAGYAPTLGRCVACGRKIAVAAAETTTPVEYSPLLGGTLCAACAPRDMARLSVAVQALRVLRRLERADTPPLDLLDEWQMTRKTQRDLRACLRRTLAVHLEIRLRSQRFLDDLLAARE
jgi:DNA repair protein RecO (recombination protein O)